MARSPVGPTTLLGRATLTQTWQEAEGSRDAVAAALAAARSAPASVSDRLGRAAGVVFTGAGSSYHLATVAAVAYRQATGGLAVAAPVSDVLLRPNGLRAAPAAEQPVVIISRSGETSEAVAVARRVRADGHRAVAVTCRPDSPLARSADDVLVSPKGDERAIVMTRSFTSMLALLLRVIARAAGDEALGRDLDSLPERWPETSAAVAAAWRIAARPWSRLVILGGGPAAGIAHEAGLKLTETSRIPVLVDTPLEFRHGPMSVCEPGVLVVGLLEAAVSEEAAVVEEARGFGATTWTLAAALDSDEETPPRSGGIVRNMLGAGMHPNARLPLLMPPLQALAVGIAVAGGHDPDAPRHLGQVVVVPGLTGR